MMRSKDKKEQLDRIYRIDMIESQNTISRLLAEARLRRRGHRVECSLKNGLGFTEC